MRSGGFWTGNRKRLCVGANRTPGPAQSPMGRIAEGVIKKTHRILVLNRFSIKMRLNGSRLQAKGEVNQALIFSLSSPVFCFFLFSNLTSPSSPRRRPISHPGDSLQGSCIFRYTFLTGRLEDAGQGRNEKLLWRHPNSFCDNAQHRTESC